MLPDPWHSFEALTAGYFAAASPDRVRAGEGWFASLSGEPSPELNICGLLPDATVRSAEELVAAIGPTLPVLVFTSGSLDDRIRGPLIEQGYGTVTTPEPLMRCTGPPERSAGPFEVTRADAVQDREAAIGLVAEANRIDRSMVSRTIGEAARSGHAQVWLAWDAGEPVSTVWLAFEGSTIGVMDVMTPARHQRRGAARVVLSGALASAWSAGVTDAVLLATPAGRHLYESLGFSAVDEVISCYRGDLDDVLDAIGNRPKPS
jgi:GNAT superfamily N-acetyltransferase